MKRITFTTLLLSLLLFFVTAVCLSAADSVQSSGSGASGFLRSHAAKLWIPLLVPSLIASLKAVWPRVPRVALPFLCPLLGAGLSFVGPLVGQEIDLGLAAALGAIGNWLREAYDQSRKSLDAVANQIAGYTMAACLLVPLGARAGSGQDDPIARRINISPFASYRISDDASRNGKCGGGLALGVALTPRIAFEAETILERFDDSHWGDSFTEAGGNFKLSLRPGRAVNPYALIGYTRNLDDVENRMNTGAGVELRLGARLAAFLDGRWTHNFDDVGHGLFRSGLSLKF